MNETDPLYKATLGGIPLQCQTTEDGFEKAISESEIPYTNGAQTEDLGLKARTIGLRCYFYDENYSNHQSLIELAKEFDLLAFVHPVYGLTNVRIKKLVVHHDDQSRAAEIDLNLIEDGQVQANIKPWQDPKAEAEKEFNNSVAEQKASVLQKILTLGAKREAMAEAAIEKFGSFMTSVANPANTLASLVDYGTDLPGRFVEAAALAVERYAIAYETLRDAPAAFQAQLAAALKDLNAQFDKFGGQVDAASAARMGLEAAGFFSADEQLSQTNNIMDQAAGFDVNGNRVSVSTDDTLNSNEIETILALTNTAIQTAVEGDRGNDSLKRMAAVLYSAAAQLKKSAENVKVVRINNPTPIHLICLRYGLPYSAAPRLLALNPQIMDPNRVSGEISIYA
ncbi:MAG: DNA circularization N-terminal domain-containing protein [Elusimicrobia bacterium]|nr:DNA circularization N-terminal domain-containing protein [Elusimicrobiota bacterium]